MCEFKGSSDSILIREGSGKVHEGCHRRTETLGKSQNFPEYHFARLIEQNKVHFLHKDTINVT